MASIHMLEHGKNWSHMKTFQEFICENAPDAHNNQGIERFEINTDALFDVIKIAYKKHRHQTEKFMQQLANIDPEIKHIMGGGKIPDRGLDNFGPEKDEVMPMDADGSPGLEDDEK